MSAFIVPNAHIDYIVSAALKFTRVRYSIYYRFTEDYRQREQVTREIATRVGRDLLAENIRSVSYRYDEPPGNLPGPVPNPDVDRYEFFPVKSDSITTVQTFKALSCYEYQSCEHPEWRTSAAYEFVRALESRMIDMMPGYDEAEWELTEETVQRNWSFALR